MAFERRFPIRLRRRPTAVVIGVVFDCDREGAETWVAVRRTVLGISALGATSGAALREATSVVLRVMAELVAKGDRAWALFTEAGP
jgi:hypothetical protein